MRVAEYIFRTLAAWGVRDVFMVSGGGALFLNAAMGRERRLNRIPCLHEQACAIAAEGYSRMSGRPGVVCVTSGPGGTNALTGVLGAWLDSAPMIVISGQVKRGTMSAMYPELGLRQLGDQEFDIVGSVRNMTKFAARVVEVEKVPDLLNRAWLEAVGGRPGPVWLDVPLDVQNAVIPAAVRKAPEPEVLEPPRGSFNHALDVLATAEAPVIVAGRGVRCAGAEKLLARAAKNLNIPVLTTPGGIDLLPADFELLFGHPGIMGNRAANFILQNADAVLAIGERMGLRVIGFNWRDLCPNSTRIMVDVDPAEFRKPSFRVDVPVECDARAFLRAVSGVKLKPKRRWLEYCRNLRELFPATPEPPGKDDDTVYVSSYRFAAALSANLRKDSVVVTGNGTAYTSLFQAMALPEGARMFGNVGCASMGYDLPAAIGAKLAAPERQVIAVTGDGSIQMNLQELATAVGRKLGLKIFVFNNNGYLSIRSSQRAFTRGKFVGTDPSNGVYLPELRKIAAAYGCGYFRADTEAGLTETIGEVLRSEGCAICEVMLDPAEKLQPKAASRVLPDGTIESRPLEDMAPPLSRAKLASLKFRREKQ